MFDKLPEKYRGKGTGAGRNAAKKPPMMLVRKDSIKGKTGDLLETPDPKKDVATSSIMRHSDAIETKQQEPKVDVVQVANRQAGGKLLEVNADAFGQNITVTHGGEVITRRAMFGPARGLPKGLAGKFTHMLLTGKITIPLTKEEADVITAARKRHEDEIAQKDAEFAIS